MVTKDMDLARCLGHFYKIKGSDICMIPKREYRIEEIVSRTNRIQDRTITIKKVRPTAPNIRAYLETGEDALLFQLKHAWTLGKSLTDDGLSVTTFIPGYEHCINIMIGSTVGIMENMYLLREEKI